MIRVRRKYRCTYRHEKQLLKQGYCRIAGVDEVGRGALCGPVVAAAVLFSGRPRVRGINDSKKLTARQRENPPQDLEGSMEFWNRNCSGGRD